MILWSSPLLNLQISENVVAKWSHFKKIHYTYIIMLVIEARPQSQPTKDPERGVSGVAGGCTGAGTAGAA